MSLPSLVVTARLSLGTRFEPENTFWDKTGALGRLAFSDKREGKKPAREVQRSNQQDGRIEDVSRPCC